MPEQRYDVITKTRDGFVRTVTVDSLDFAVRTLKRVLKELPDTTVAVAVRRRRARHRPTLFVDEL